jgi:nucleoid DNA-binding protein
MENVNVEATVEEVAVVAEGAEVVEKATASKFAGVDAISRALQKEVGGTIKDAAKYYKGLCKVVKELADSGLPVRIEGIGNVRHGFLEAGTARNPQDGTSIEVPRREKYFLKSRVTPVKE